MSVPIDVSALTKTFGIACIRAGRRWRLWWTTESLIGAARRLGDRRAA